MPKFTVFATQIVYLECEIEADDFDAAVQEASEFTEVSCKPVEINRVHQQ